MLLRDNLQPTDFADSEVRVSDWRYIDGDPAWEGHRAAAYRVWVCRCTNWWFQRHEWAIKGKNSTEMEQWILSGYWPRRQWEPHFKPAPKDYDA